MTEPLKHDPQTKQQIKDVLYDLLYQPLQKQFQEKLNKIIYANCLAGKHSHKSFIYRNTTYSCDTEALPRRMNRLQPQLQPEMDDYLRLVKELNSAELPLVLGFINRVLNSSNELHDYLRLLPESVHFPIQFLIDTCPCRNKKLAEGVVEDIKEESQDVIQLMRQRMMLNLLI